MFASPRSANGSRRWTVLAGALVAAGAGATGLSLSRGDVPTAALAPSAPAMMRFEPNHGQWHSSIRFLARGRGQGLSLTDQGATLELLRPSRGAKVAARSLPRFERAVLALRVAGGRAVTPVGAEPLSGSTSHFVGRDPAHWTTKHRSFGRVRYPGVLPGVDLVFRGAGEGQLEYDLELAPGADPAAAALVFEGAETLEVEPAGSALLRLPGGFQIRQPPPVAYQEDGMGGRAMVAARYVRRPDATLGFVVEGHDRARPLVIDPTLVYSTYLGGASADAAFAVAGDNAGNAYLTGYTVSANFPTAGGQLPHGGGVDLFVTKLSAAGSPVYSTYLGGAGADIGLAIAVDGSGSAYVAGETTSADFPTVSAFQGARAGAVDAFVVKLGPAGSTLVYSTYLGGTADDIGQAIAVDAAGRAHLTGQTFSAGFPTSAPLQVGFGGERDAFVTKLSSAGNALLYSTFLGGSYDDFGQGIGLDADGNAYVGGYTFSPDFPTVAALQPTGAAGFHADAFVSKINGAGLALVYSTYLGGSGDEQAYGLTVASSGSAAIGGYTSSFDFPVVAASQPAFQGGATDGFVSRLDPDGSALTYSTYLGGAGNDLVYGVAGSSSGRVHVAGYTTSSNFPTTPLAPQATLGGGYDAFAAALSPAGVPVLSTYLGGAGTDYGLAVGAASSSLLVAGQTDSTNFPTTAPLQPVPGGGDDAFVVRFNFETAAVPASDRSVTLALGAALAMIGIASLLRKQRAP